MISQITTFAPSRIACPECGELVELEIPVEVRIVNGQIYGRVRDELPWEQPAWDHQLYAHGPKEEQ